MKRGGKHQLLDGDEDDLSSGLSSITEDEEETNRRRVGHINDRDEDVKRIGLTTADESSDSSDSDGDNSYRQESRIFVRNEWKGERKPEGVNQENWFLLDYDSWHFKFHFRRYKRRAVRTAVQLKDFTVGLPWHHIRVALIFLLFLGGMALFMSVDAPDDDPPTFLAGNLRSPSVLLNLNSGHHRLLDHDEPLDTIRVNLAIQETRNVSEWTSWPIDTLVTVTLQASTAPDEASALEWTDLDSWELAANEAESEEDNTYFYLNDTQKDVFHTYRVVVSTNAQQNLGLQLDVLQLSWVARYEVVIGFLLLVVVYSLIIFELVHRTVASLIGSFWGLALLSAVIERPTLLDVIEWIDYDTIGLLFGMMILVGIFSTTGFFEWSAVQAYKLSKGNIWHLVIMLCGFTAVASMFLDNVTTILLVTPVTLRLCRVLDLDPLPVILAEVIFSNIGGTATGIGDPPNILIISNSQIKESGLVDFTSFTLHVAPGAILAMITTFVLISFVYKKKICQRAPMDPLQKEIEIWKKTLHNFDTSQKGITGNADHRVRHKLVVHIHELEERLREKLAGIAALEAALEGGGHHDNGAGAGAGGGGHHNAGAGVSDENKGKEKVSEAEPKPSSNGDGHGDLEEGRRKRKSTIALGEVLEEDEEDVLADEDDGGRAAAESGNSGAAQELGTINIAEMERKYIISDVTLFIKSCCVLVVVILLFFLHSFLTEINLSLPWIAILGALVLLVLSGAENFHEILEKVETSTLLFFAGLFVMVRCVEELGVTLWIANTTSDIIDVMPEGKTRLAFAVFLLTWVCAIVSMFIDNIPFTTTMIPVVVKLTKGSLALPLQPLTWAMAFGACLGGNGTLIGASANVVAAGIAEQYGRPISFNYFFKMGFPCMMVSTITATAYLLITHVLIEWY